MIYIVFIKNDMLGMYYIILISLTVNQKTTKEVLMYAQCIYMTIKRQCNSFSNRQFLYDAAKETEGILSSEVTFSDVDDNKDYRFSGIKSIIYIVDCWTYLFHYEMLSFFLFYEVLIMCIR